MCRLAYIANNFTGLASWLHQMEESKGGDGTGFASYDVLHKSVDMNWQESYDKMCETAYLPVLWHSRKVSSAKKRDALCHPFSCDDGYLAHNGHWFVGDAATWIYADITGETRPSDTALFATVVDKLGFYEAVMKYEPEGVWLHMNKESGDLSVWKKGGSLHYCPALKTWGSEPYKQKSWFSVKNGFYDYGDRPKKEKKIFLKTENVTLLGGNICVIDSVTGKLVCNEESITKEDTQKELPWWKDRFK